ncbi:lysozyme inhibitor LprI family protein [Methylobacterium sp. ARG-1]|uniref:lysozyme inhibitor LprI family protein n=1 Tax=Methylobacterium sp. ARG-1 TaxID=1692501 RepID=UPI001FCCEF50|nr:lysozyme inhibitor LprI family protein [Methylobacterium sp. ARG-1]
MRAAQKAWFSYRDATCALETMGREGGSAYPMKVSGCLKGLTDARTKVLKTYLACKPDDVSCVGAFQEWPGVEREGLGARAPPQTRSRRARTIASSRRVPPAARRPAASPRA